MTSTNWYRLNLAAVIYFIFCLCSCNKADYKELSIGLMENGIYKNKDLNLCIEPAIYATIHSTGENASTFSFVSNPLETIKLDEISESASILLIKDVFDINLSLINPELMGHAGNDKTKAFFIKKIQNMNNKANISGDIKLIKDEWVSLNGQEYKHYAYEITLDQTKIFEKQYLINIYGRHLMFHFTGKEDISEQQIIDLFNGIDFNCQ